jgi:hypothetical protein
MVDPMGPRDRARPAVVLLLLAACLGACKSPPEPPPPFVGPAVETEVTHFVGSPVSGPRAGAAIPPDAMFHQVLVRLYAVERYPEDYGVPAASRARLVVARRGHDRPLLAAARATERVRIGLGKRERGIFLEALRNRRWGRRVRLGTLRGALTSGLTSMFSVRSAAGLVRVQVHRGAADLALVAKDVQVALVAGAAEACLVESEREGEVHVLTAVFPSPFPDGTGEALAAVVEISPPPTGSTKRDAHREAVARSIEDAARAAADRTGLEPIEVPVWTGLADALAGLDSPSTRRGALAYLARETGASFAEDLALSAPEAVVSDVAERVAGAERPDAPSALGFLIEHAAFRAACAATEAGDARCEALLLTRAGEVGRHPALLEELLGKAGHVEDLGALLVRENLVFLTDSSPAARVRAYDWLALNGPVPDGYDPLGPRDERRESVSRYIEKALESGEFR